MRSACSWNASALIFSVLTDVKGQQITLDEHFVLSIFFVCGRVTNQMSSTLGTLKRNKIKLFLVCVEISSCADSVSCAALAFSFAYSGSHRKRELAVDNVQDHMACLMAFRMMEKA